MPRPNQPRSIASEQALARRLAFEREARGMSYDGLASRVTQAGCAIQSSAIYKIEKGDPPRRITVDELVAFSRVFQIPVDRLLQPPEVAAREELADLFTAWDEAALAYQSADSRLREAWESLRRYVDGHPDLEPVIKDVVEVWSEYYWKEDESLRVSERDKFMSALHAPDKDDV